MSRHWSIACLIALLAATACQVSLPGTAALPAAITPSPNASSPTPFNQPEPTLTREVGQLLTTQASVTPLSSPAYLLPSPTLPVAFSPPVISASNASLLQPILHRKFGLWDHVLKIVWSPQGSTLAASAGETLHILEAEDLDEQLEIEMGSWAPDLAYAPEGDSIAAVDRHGMLRIWDAASGELIQSIQAHQKSASGVAYSPDGSLLATAGYDAMARLWQLPGGELQGEMIGGSFAIPAIAFTPDGINLAIVNGNIIRLRDVESTRFVKTIAAENPVFNIAFSPDGSRLASGDVANTVQLWDMSSDARPEVEIRHSLYTLAVQDEPVSGPRALVWQVAFNPDGSLLAAASGDGKIRIWEVESGALVATLAGRSRAATSLAFSPDGRWLASGGLDGQLILWGVDS